MRGSKNTLANQITNLAAQADDLCNTHHANGEVQVIENILKLYIAAWDNFRPLDPTSPDHEFDDKQADCLTDITSSLAEKAASFPCDTEREVIAKLILSLLESDAGNGMMAHDDRSARLSVSAAADLLRLTGASDLIDLLDAHGIKYFTDTARNN